MYVDEVLWRLFALCGPHIEKCAVEILQLRRVELPANQVLLLSGVYRLLRTVVMSLMSGVWFFFVFVRGLNGGIMMSQSVSGWDSSSVPYKLDHTRIPALRIAVTFSTVFACGFGSVINGVIDVSK